MKSFHQIVNPPKKKRKRKTTKKRKTTTKKNCKKISKEYGYKKLWLGDYDRDGVPNIDDTYPFDSKRKKRVNKEISLSKAFRNVQKVRKNYQKDLPAITRKNKAIGGRVKDTYSIINKQMTRNLRHVQDLGGIRVYAKTRKEVKLKARRIRDKYAKKGHLLEYEDKYKQSLKDQRAGKINPYMAIHLTVLKNGRPWEIQVKTPQMSRLADIMHTAYKQGNKKKLLELQKEANRLYRLGY